MTQPTFVGPSQPTPLWREDELGFHLLIGSAPGTGRSVMLAAEALRRGMTYEELVAETRPTQEEITLDGAAAAEDDAVYADRLSAVRDAFWLATPESHADRAHLADLLASVAAAEASPARLKAFFDMLPAEIVGDAVAWGLGDTEVRERIFAFAKEKRSQVLEVVGALA